MSFLFNTIRSLTTSTILEEDIEESNEVDSGGVRLPSPRGSVTKMGIPDAESDFNQWLHAMKMVAHLPGGMPPDFRRKLWLALSDRYLQTKNVNWKKEEEKCFSETWGADDQELGAQIVKDLHRTGSSLCSGPAAAVNQAKLKRILLGYARWNPEVGYCQGFNMLGALILQVMDKNESDAIKVMIFLIEGLIPSGYFHGSLFGLQADMAVFRELLGTKLPRLAKHLQKLQGQQEERAFEPPLTNVFTMQWFLTLFCNCLPINCVLRVWDLILIEGSDILLRTALAIWSLLEEKILMVRTADDFYCKMGLLSGELLNGTLIDSNGLVQKIVDLGPIQDLDKMRERHRQIIPSVKQKKGLKVFYSDDDMESDEESKVAVATVWGGLRGQSRRNSQPNVRAQNNVDTKEPFALDINILKKQYNKLKERQKQAHVILSSAVARQSPNPPSSSSASQVNNLLAGKNAIISNKRRAGPIPGSIPPSRTIKQSKPIKILPKSIKTTDTGNWKNVKAENDRQTSLNWKDIKQEENDATKKRAEDMVPKKRHDSSSYSEDSDSSTSTSLCDDDPPGLSCSSVEGSPLKKDFYQVPEENRVENLEKRIADLTENFEDEKERQMLEFETMLDKTISKEENQRPNIKFDDNNDFEYERIVDDEHDTDANLLDLQLTGSFSPLEEFSPICDAPKFISISPISPLRTPSPILDYTSFLKSLQSNSTSTASTNIQPYRQYSESSPSSSHVLEIKNNSSNINREHEPFIVTDEGVTNELFERINSSDPNLRSPNTVLELSVAPSVLPETSIIPACADMAAIPSDRSPLINKLVFEIDSKPVNDKTLMQKMDVSTEKMSNKKESVESDRALSLMEENTNMLSRLLSKKRNSIETPLVNTVNMDTTAKEVSPPNIQDIEPETYSKAIQIHQTSVEKCNSTKNIRHVHFPEDNKISDKISPNTSSSDLDSQTSTKEVLPNTTDISQSHIGADQSKNENYFIDTIDEIAMEQESRKAKQQITELDSLDDSRLLHEELEFVERNLKEDESVALDVSDTKKQKNYFDKESDLSKQIKLEVVHDDKKEIGSKIIDTPERAIINDLDKSKNVIQKYHMSSFDEMTQEIRKELKSFKTEYSEATVKSSNYDIKSPDRRYSVPSKYESLKLENKANEETSTGSSSFNKKSSDFDLDLSTDTLKSLLNETRQELTKEMYGCESKLVVKSERLDESRINYPTRPETYETLNKKRNESSNSNEIEFTKTNSNKPVLEPMKADTQTNTVRTLDVSVNKNSNNSCSDSKLSPRAELRAVLTAPSCKESMDLSYLDDIREPSDDNRDLKLFSSYDQIKTPNLRESTNITEKLSSISKTINSINSLCRGETKYELTYKTLERYCGKKDVYSVRKEMDQNKMDKLLCDILSKSDKKPPIVRIVEADDALDSILLRRSRETSRDSSPRRLLFGENDDFSSSLSKSSPTHANFGKLDRYLFKKESELLLSNIKYDFKAKSSENLASKYDKCSSKYPDKLEIRHTTVTSTFYDRYIYQKREQSAKLDKSPSSPIITRAYLDSLRPTTMCYDRVSKSAESSPSRFGSAYSELPISGSTTRLPLSPDPREKPFVKLDYMIKSCDNIPNQFIEVSSDSLMKSKPKSNHELISISYKSRKNYNSP